ncbi:MAG: polymerase sigma-70 factor, subfamily [Mycobacterium sp.]|jgi:RNA polymerase sigma-70 factor (ECF subfamily)|nr:polymerase sigma-70 factor, subfamily [Mycobacterium sp.]
MADSDVTARFVRDAVPLWRPLARHARRLTLTPADADDLMQETMLKAYAAFRSFEPEGNLHAWLSRIMVNTWISAHRFAQRRPAECLTGEITDRQVASYGSHMSSGSISAEAQVLAALPDRRIRDALDQLPTELRMVVMYADIHGYRLREIAEIMHIPHGTVASRLHRAHKRLRAQLAELADDRSYNGSGRGASETGGPRRGQSRPRT